MRSAGDPRLIAILTDAAQPPGDADARALTHAFHAWPGRMHPYTARVLIDASPAGVVSDPFMGGGTVLVEAALAERGAYGADVNPVAVEVAWARTRSWPVEQLEAFKRRGAAMARMVREQRDRPTLPRHVMALEGAWFDPPALADIWRLSQLIEAEPDPVLRRMLAICLSSILVKASRQASDSNTRLDRDHRWVPSGRVLQWFSARVDEHARNLQAFRAALGPRAIEPGIWQRDARADPAPWLQGPVAAMVTSPPYPGVYDYVEHHRRRYGWLGSDMRMAEQTEIGARRDQRHMSLGQAHEAYEDQVRSVLSAWAPRLMGHGRIWWVVGDGQHKNGLIDVLPLIERGARDAGLRVLASVSQPRTRFEHVTPRAQGRRERYEHILVMGHDR